MLLMLMSGTFSFFPDCAPPDFHLFLCSLSVYNVYLCTGSMVYLSVVDGVILQLQYSTLVGAITMLQEVSIDENTTTIIPYIPSVNITGVRRLGRSAATSAKLLPSWVKVVHLSPLSSRVHSVAVLPQRRQFVAPPSLLEDDNRHLAQFWSNTNILFVDTNQQTIGATSEKGFPITEVDVSITPFLMAWPSHLIVKPAVEDKDGDSFSTFDVYVSEFLGRIWKWTLSVDAEGKTIGRVNFSREAIPMLLLDKSVFPASIRIREVLNEAKTSGVPSYDKLFFEITN